MLEFSDIQRWILKVATCRYSDGLEWRYSTHWVLELKACVVNHGYILQGILGSYGACKCPGMSQSTLLPLEDSDLGCVGNWKTSGSCSSEPFRCGNFHLRS